MRVYLLDANGITAWCHYSSLSVPASLNAAESAVRSWWTSFSAEMIPSYAVACFDCSRESNWRKKMFVEYKSARDSKPRDTLLADTVAIMPSVFADLGVPVLKVEGFEADDLIATLAESWSGEVVIVSTDKDLRQLVDERVTVYDPMPNKAGKCVFYDEAMVFEKNHVPPDRLREALAIMGDSSDSIPGVPGLGKVAAVTMVNQTRSRLEMIRMASERKLKNISVKKQETFIEHLSYFELSYELVGLKSDACIPEGFDFKIRTIQTGRP